MFSNATKQSASETVDDAEKTYNNAKNDVRNAAQSRHNDLNQTAHQAGQKVRGVFDTMQHDIEDVGQRLTTEIQNNPARSSLIALGVGIVLGVLLRR